jgi:hypothetical protein
MNKFNTIITALFTCLLILNCGGASTDSSNENNEESSSNSSSSSSSNNSDHELEFSFGLSLTISDDDQSLEVDFPSQYDLDLYLSEEGELTVYAKDFPTMVYRICMNSSDLSGCHSYSDELGIDADIVIDSCGRLVSDEDCGNQDNTSFSGTIDSDGSMSINSISIRTRLFAINSDSSGYTADESDTGLIELNRMVISINTDDTSSGSLVANGNPIDDSEVTLVAAGTLSSAAPALAGADFVTEISGSFDENPLDILSD